MSAITPRSSQQRYFDSPTYWFAMLEIARERQRPGEVAEANRQLRRLGVVVEWAPNHAGKAGGNA